MPTVYPYDYTLRSGASINMNEIGAEVYVLGYSLTLMANETSSPHHRPNTDRHMATAGTSRKGAYDRESIRSIVSTVAIILIAPLIALFLTAFVFQPYEVEGESMETTLQNNDRLIVWKMPRTWSRITGHDYTPKRGDIVIFSEPTSIGYNTGGPKQLIKRTIGLPGERVVVKDGEVTVYNSDHPEGLKPDKTLPYGKVIGDTPGDLDIVVPEGSIFVLGDNRGSSLDSRSFGPVDVNNIAGKLVMRVLPLGNAERF